MQRAHTCLGQIDRVFYCLPCRLRIALAHTKYGDHLFEERPADMMKLIKAQSHSLSIQADTLTWKAFRAGHATHLALIGCEIKVIMQAGEWKSVSYAAYFDYDSLDNEVFLNATLEASDMEDNEDPQ